MKVCVSLRAPAWKNLRSGNLRSEERWERQALEASLVNPEVTEVYTVGCQWLDAESSKYRGDIDAETAADTVLLIQDWNLSIIGRFRWKGILVNIFSGPWVEQIPEVRDLAKLYESKLVFSLGFSALYREPAGSGECSLDTPPAVQHLLKFLNPENIVLLPVPGVPSISSGNNFDKRILFYPGRIIFVSTLGESPAILWALRKLQVVPDLELIILTGWEKWEVKDLIDGEVVRDLTDDINDLFWRQKSVRPFLDVRPRVTVLLSISWEDVLDIFSQTKLLITTGKQFGGPPLEAGKYGIPFVACRNTGALADCPNYLYTGDDFEVHKLFDRLLEDKDFYTKVGDSYRDFVEERYTFEAFNRNLNQLLRQRGLL